MDDEEVIRDVASMILAEMGCGVETCRDGNEAVELYRRALEQGKRYDAVILDLTIPGGMGCLDAATQIRSLDPGATLIVSSGYSQDAVMADFQSYGFSGSVMKPYSMDTMCNELARVMGTKGQRVQ
jgi:CheY-like chemotaxis protein